MVFEHIYIEEKALKYPKTKEITDRFPGSRKVMIEHYKDVFNRRGQNFMRQKSAPALILAVNEGRLIFEGAPTCQNFGYDEFYYTSQIKNCIYDCEYCYLQGMYPTGNMVVFVNGEDYFEETDRLSKDKRISLSISYDTDMNALNGITGILNDWMDYAEKNPNVLIEVRTKCASTEIFNKVIPKNVIMAYTISPSAIAREYEHGASGYEARKKAVYRSLSDGVRTRVCFDPVFPTEDFEKVYGDMLDDIFSESLMKNIEDVSIGSFRISKEYIKAMQKARYNAMTAYPFEIRDGICTFEQERVKDMLRFMTKKLEAYVETEKIFSV